MKAAKLNWMQEKRYKKTLTVRLFDHWLAVGKKEFLENLQCNGFLCE
jgi:hypothetical protein